MCKLVLPENIFNIISCMVYYVDKRRRKITIKCVRRVPQIYIIKTNWQKHYRQFTYLPPNFSKSLYKQRPNRITESNLSLLLFLHSKLLQRFYRFLMAHNTPLAKEWRRQGGCIDVFFFQYKSRSHLSPRLPFLIFSTPDSRQSGALNKNKARERISVKFHFTSVQQKYRGLFAIRFQFPFPPVGCSLLIHRPIFQRPLLWGASILYSRL